MRASRPRRPLTATPGRERVRVRVRGGGACGGRGERVRGGGGRKRLHPRPRLPPTCRACAARVREARGNLPWSQLRSDFRAERLIVPKSPSLSDHFGSFFLLGGTRSRSSHGSRGYSCMSLTRQNPSGKGQPWFNVL